MVKPANNFKGAAIVIGALVMLSAAPTTALAEANGPGGCHYTDKLIDNGDDVLVDGKIVSCRRGSIVVTVPPDRVSASGPLTGVGNPALTEVTPAPQPRKNPKFPVIDLPVLTTGR